MHEHFEDKGLILLEPTAQKAGKAIGGDEKLKIKFDQRIAESRDNKVASSF